MKGHTYSRRRPAPVSSSNVHQERICCEAAMDSNTKGKLRDPLYITEARASRYNRRLRMHPYFRISMKLYHKKIHNMQAESPKEATKACSKCGHTLPISQFYKDKRAKDGHKSACKSCSR